MQHELGEWASSRSTSEGDRTEPGSPLPSPRSPSPSKRYIPTPEAPRKCRCVPRHDSKKIAVCGLSGKLGDVLVDDPATTIRGLKQIVENTLGIPVFEQRLFIDLHELRPDYALCPATLGKASGIHLVRRPLYQAAHLERLCCGMWVWDLASEPEELRSDRELALALVDQDGNFLEHLSSELRADAEVVQRAVQTTPKSFAHACEGLKANRDFVLSLVQESLREDDNFIDRLLDDPLGTFRPAQEILQYAASEVRQDEQVIDTLGFVPVDYEPAPKHFVGDCRHPQVPAPLPAVEDFFAVDTYGLPVVR